MSASSNQMAAVQGYNFAFATGANPWHLDGWGLRWSPFSEEAQKNFFNTLNILAQRRYL